ncbi:Uncharacterised protein [Citrobacter koseri]|nr:Uncharacterised protein [Citrobacter koseri]
MGSACCSTTNSPVLRCRVYSAGSGYNAITSPQPLRHFQNGHITEGQPVKYGCAKLFMRQTAVLIVGRHHVAAGIQHAAVLRVQVNQLCQRQTVNRERPVFRLIVIPDVCVVCTGGQDGFWFTQAD